MTARSLSNFLGSSIISNLIFSPACLEPNRHKPSIGIQNSNEDLCPSIPNANNLIQPGRPSDRDPEGACVPDHCPDAFEEPGPTALNQGSFQPALLDLKEGEPDTEYTYLPSRS